MPKLVKHEPYERGATAAADAPRRPFRPAMVPRVDERSGGNSVSPAGQAFVTVEIADGVDAARYAWTALVPNALATPYQHPAFLSAWFDHIAAHEGLSSMIVVACDAAGAPVALLPLCVRSFFGVSVASFMGGSHVNYNVPVIRRDALARFTAAECLRLLREAAAIAGVDVYALSNQPLAWSGLANPFAALPRQPSPDAAYSGPLAPSLEEHLSRFVSAKSRSNQRRKMRRFDERGTSRIYRAETASERTKLLDAYFEQKGRQFAARGVPNVFAKPGVRYFMATACGLSGGTPAIDLYGFDLDGETIAVTGGLADGERYCGMVISITDGEHAKYSPGEMLMNFVVEDSIRRGLKTFDLGVGAAGYKKMYCPNAEELFDTVLGMTLRGRVAARAVSAKTAAKARLKASPTAKRLVARLRSLTAAKSTEATAETD